MASEYEWMNVVKAGGDTDAAFRARVAALVTNDKWEVESMIPADVPIIAHLRKKRT